MAEHKLKEMGSNWHPLKYLYDAKIPMNVDNQDTYIFYTSCECGVMLRDPKIVEALYTTKNKFFSKHPFLKDLYNCLLGDSILFAETTPEWRESRKVISPAFYKGKLERLVLIARDTMRTTIKILQDKV